MEVTDVSAGRLEYCETWGWKQGVRMRWQTKRGVLGWYSSAQDVIALPWYWHPLGQKVQACPSLGKGWGDYFP